MTPARWAKIRQTFDNALDRPEKDRVAFLHFACGADEDLRREVESLLQSYEQSADFLATPAVHLDHLLAAGMMHTEGFAPAEPTTSTSGIPGNAPSLTRSPSDDPYEDLRGHHVGPYEFERRIGHGGMGSVWLATRSDHEYKKQVAVKVVRRGMDSQEILRRFRLERQMLANLEHPNIARLIDGGSTPEGMPFLVMEYVEGIPIDSYCQQHQLSISARLQLFRAVCSSVQYAHQHLIVHRDIKTTNILVNGEGIPKLLDFGIAKLLRDESTLSTLSLDLTQTLPHLRPMTIDYASPEQVRGDPITTATDIYSLGILLYKLLSGRMPFGPDGGSFKAMQRAIRDKQPPPPSEVVLTSENWAIPQATQALEARSETVDKARRRLRRKLTGDLDAIVLKAMSKQPQERYASAEQLSEDIRRYLEGLPLKARAGTPGYRFAKLIRRHAKTIAAAAIIGLALLAAAVGSGFYAQKAVRNGSETAARNEKLRRRLMHTESELGLAKMANRDYGAADLAFNNSLDIARELLEAETANPGVPGGTAAVPDIDTQIMIAENHANLARVLLGTGATKAALEKLEEARHQYQQILALDGAKANRAIPLAIRAIDQLIESASAPPIEGEPPPALDPEQ